MSADKLTYRLVEKIRLAGSIETRTGLHIGGADVGLRVGGADKLVVRSAKDDAPYIPGSSIKGKMRSLLEKAGYAKNVRPENRNGKFVMHPCSCASLDCPVCIVFGVSAEQAVCGPSRLIVRDGVLKNGDEIAKWRHLDMHLTEVKTEVAIDRLTSAANPRNFERVPAGAKFELELILNVLQGDDDHVKLLLDGLALLAVDYLGGQGTRGYGAVKVAVDKIEKLDLAALRSGEERWVAHPAHPTPWVRPSE